MALTGLTLDGGISSVSRCVTRVLDDEQANGSLERVDRVLYLDAPPGWRPPPPPSRQLFARGSRLRFALLLAISVLLGRPRLIVFDHVGLTRTLRFLSPARGRLRYALFLHGIEVPRAPRWTLERAHLLLVNSPHTREQVAKLHPDLLSRIRVLSLCIEPERVDRWTELATTPEMQRKSAVMIVGRMWAEQRGKGHDSLLEAWSRVLERIPNAELWIVGGGDDRPRLEQKAAALEHTSSVRFFGRISDDELSRLYRSASVFAMPSRQEGFGLVYLEAMHHGLPCIGSNADAARCVIDETTGILVPYGDPAALADAITRLLANPALARSLGRSGQVATRSRFSFERFRSDLLSALSSIL